MAGDGSAQLWTCSVLPLLQAYMDAENTPNFIQLLEALAVVLAEFGVRLPPAEFGVRLPPLVLQLRADFETSIENACRSRPVK